MILKLKMELVRQKALVTLKKILVATIILKKETISIGSVVKEEYIAQLDLQLITQLRLLKDITPLSTQILN
jgi:hypothetical protein